MDLFSDPAIWLPWTFAALMGLSILMYVILDGFDLGVGLLVPLAEDEDKDLLVASIGPFWDANETWLVLAIGLLLVAFPTAHGIILSALYLPVFVMLVGLILRGVSFEFRAKAPASQKPRWNVAFFVGSLMASMSQGFMLGMYVMGLTWTLPHVAFALLTAVFLTVGYSFIGAAWLIAKTSGELQKRAVGWAKRGIWGLILGIAAISMATPYVSARIYEKWFSMPEMLYLSPLPLLSAAMVLYLLWQIKRLPQDNDRSAWGPFMAAMALFVLAFGGMAYSFYPYVVPEQITIYEAASAPESLLIILIGTLFVLPAILGYTILSYSIFRGKATELRYD
ncbi:cytochrome d ubiquinol oxidase subunit II [Sulfitobacter noctilucicola]|uniref:Cytochrome d ubiquinol oxidase subunit II n=1 Tax=Sulfitobacter noctilucicola TaxID=1342301 RepID=A0A7W6Q696_9RHOB|nr:cytochrome d ubiquinol oxidase subunit II [Sulfitobacter noctilucicola]MBB4174580.1 cytochrome d ubiquinol oxidase subunit II [Sulfitobacter noctilucicola]